VAGRDRGADHVAQIIFDVAAAEPELARERRHGSRLAGEDLEQIFSEGHSARRSREVVCAFGEASCFPLEFLGNPDEFLRVGGETRGAFTIGRGGSFVNLSHCISREQVGCQPGPRNG
jgi:hypothetical protein